MGKVDKNGNVKLPTIWTDVKGIKYKIKEMKLDHIQNARKMVVGQKSAFMGAFKVLDAIYPTSSKHQRELEHDKEEARQYIRTLILFHKAFDRELDRRTTSKELEPKTIYYIKENPHEEFKDVLSRYRGDYYNSLKDARKEAETGDYIMKVVITTTKVKK